MRRDLRSPHRALVSLASTRVDPPPIARDEPTSTTARLTLAQTSLAHPRPSSSVLPFERTTARAPVVSSPDRVTASRVSHPYLRAPPPAFDPFARRPVLDVHPGRARAHDDE